MILFHRYFLQDQEAQKILSYSPDCGLIGKIAFFLTLENKYLKKYWEIVDGQRNDNGTRVQNPKKSRPFRTARCQYVPSPKGYDSSGHIFGILPSSQVIPTRYTHSPPNPVYAAANSLQPSLSTLSPPWLRSPSLPNTVGGKKNLYVYKYKFVYLKSRYLFYHVNNFGNMTVPSL